MMPDARSEALRKAPLDSWVALSADQSKVVGVGASYEEVSAKLNYMGDTDSVILKTPPAWLPLAL
jgi:hypothetical protein